MLLCSNALFVGRERHSIRASCTRLPMGPVIGDIGGDADPHKTVAIPHCLGPMAVLFTSVVGLAGWLLMMCARAIAWLRPSNSANVPRLHLWASPIDNKSLQHQP